MRRASSILAASSLAGCSLFVDLGGISDEPPVTSTDVDSGGPIDSGGPNDGAGSSDVAGDAGALSVLRRMTFEQGNLVDPTTGADSVLGTMTIENAAPIAGAFSARVTSAPDRGYLREDLPTSTEVVVTFSLRVVQRPSMKLRILRVGTAADPGAELSLSPSGSLEIEDGASAVLDTTKPYRVELRVRGGAAGTIETRMASLPDALGAPFVSVTRPVLNTFDRMWIGQTITQGYGVDLVLDDIEVAAR